VVQGNGEGGEALDKEINLKPGDYFIDLGVAEKLPERDEPIDIRKGVIHLHVDHGRRFDGLVELEVSSDDVMVVGDSYIPMP